VETIIAVNTNKNAPICSLAALVVEGDAVEFIDRLITKLKQNSLNFKEETQ
jgi:electron transfer flavoprotein alpha subunit